MSDELQRMLDIAERRAEQARDAEAREAWQALVKKLRDAIDDVERRREEIVTQRAGA